MIGRVGEYWWLILASVSILLLGGGGDFWDFNVMELFATIAIVLGGTWTVTRLWREHRRNTLLRMKHVRNSWGKDSPTVGASPWLDVELKFLPREEYQVSSFELHLADRNCTGSHIDPFIPEKRSRKVLRFAVPTDISRITSHAYIMVMFAGAEFRTEMFRVEARR